MEVYPRPIIAVVVPAVITIIAAAIFELCLCLSCGDYLNLEIWKQNLDQILPARLTASASPSLSSFVCNQQHTYSTEIVSVDPLIIYLQSFISSDEIRVLLQAGEPSFQPSLLTGNDGLQKPSKRRTSRSAVLEIDNPAVICVLDRARRFMGATLTLPHDDFQPPQLVRYAPGQRFEVHADWFSKPQDRKPDSSGIGSSWNRPASFLAILEDNCNSGETWFPNVDLRDPAAAAPGDKAWRRHEQGGLAFRPVKGNALFWVNLLANGTGDERVLHAGLPVESGLKIAMNIWPREYYL